MFVFFYGYVQMHGKNDNRLPLGEAFFKVL